MILGDALIGRRQLKGARLVGVPALVGGPFGQLHGAWRQRRDLASALDRHVEQVFVLHNLMNEADAQGFVKIWRLSYLLSTMATKEQALLDRLATSAADVGVGGESEDEGEVVRDAYEDDDL